MSRSGGGIAALLPIIAMSGLGLGTTIYNILSQKEQETPEQTAARVATNAGLDLQGYPNLGPEQLKYMRTQGILKEQDTAPPNAAPESIPSILPPPPQPRGIPQAPQPQPQQGTQPQGQPQPQQSGQGYTPTQSQGTGRPLPMQPVPGSGAVNPYTDMQGYGDESSVSSVGALRGTIGAPSPSSLLPHLNPDFTKAKVTIRVNSKGDYSYNIAPDQQANDRVVAADEQLAYLNALENARSNLGLTHPMDRNWAMRYVLENGLGLPDPEYIKEMNMTEGQVLDALNRRIMYLYSNKDLPTFQNLELCWMAVAQKSSFTAEEQRTVNDNLFSIKRFSIARELLEAGAYADAGMYQPDLIKKLSSRLAAEALGGYTPTKEIVEGPPVGPSPPTVEDLPRGTQESLYAASDGVSPDTPIYKLPSTGTGGGGRGGGGVVPTTPGTQPGAGGTTGGGIASRVQLNDWRKMANAATQAAMTKYAQLGAEMAQSAEVAEAPLEDLLAFADGLFTADPTLPLIQGVEWDIRAATISGKPVTVYVMDEDGNEVPQQFKFGEAYSLYKSKVQNYVSLLARLYGHRGVLTELDVQKVFQGLANPYRDNVRMKDDKKRNLRRLLNEMKGRVVEDPAGNTFAADPKWWTKYGPEQGRVLTTDKEIDAAVERQFRQWAGEQGTVIGGPTAAPPPSTPPAGAGKDYNFYE